jgi:carboxyl-terminal processing protease
VRNRNIRTLLLAIVFGSTTFLFGWYLGSEGYRFDRARGFVRQEPTVVANNISSRPESLPFDWDTFERVWQELNTRYVDQPLDSQALFYGALKGLAAAVGDPYTAFLPPPENKEVKDSLNGRYEGIGAELGMRNNQLTVIAPLDGSPAEAAGIQAADIILKIDDISTAELNLNEAVSRIRGPTGTVVRLTLLRPSTSLGTSEGQSLKRGEGEPFEVEIKREQITVKSISWKDKGDGIVHIRASRFGESTSKDWDNITGEIIKDQSSMIKSIILDLRSNPGGYLQASIHLASEFVDHGVIVYEEFGDGQRQEFLPNHRGRLLQVPVVVLIDGGSASASEILAAALRDLDGATLVGQPSFGKGTVQDAVEFDDRSSLHVTIARWLTPQGENIDGVGLKPDVVVDLPEADVKNGRDPQLEKAMEIAKGL